LVNSASTSKLSKYKLDLVALKVITCNSGSSKAPDDYTFLNGKWNTNHKLVTRLFVQNGIEWAKSASGPS